MRKLLELLRDPIWQMLGVLVAVLTVFITSSQSDPGPKELVSVHVRQGRIIDQWMPGSRVQVLIEGSNFDPDKAVADYFFLYNNSSNAIAPTDFVSRLEITPRQGAVVKQVRSCSESFAQVCSTDGSSTPSGGAYVRTEWKVVGGKWSAEGPLINKDDVMCVLVVSEPKDDHQRGTPFADVSARVKGFNFRSFGSLNDFAASKQRWYHSFYTMVYFEGLAVYWLVALAGTMMLASLRLLHLAISGASRSLKQSLIEVAVALLSISTAEILTDVYFNRGGNFLDPSVHIIVWPLLAFHTIVLLFLIAKAARARRTYGVRSQT